MITHYCPSCWHDIAGTESRCPACGFEQDQDQALSFEAKLLRFLEALSKIQGPRSRVLLQKASCHPISHFECTWS